MMGTKNIGSSFDDFLEKEGLLGDATATAVKRFIAYQLAEKMSEDSLSKSEMARRMETSRSALDRLLDSSNPAVTLQTLQSAASALGGRLKVELDFGQKLAWASLLVIEAVRETLSEDAEDLAAFEDREKEPELMFEEVVKDLKQRGKI